MVSRNWNFGLHLHRAPLAITTLLAVSVFGSPVCAQSGQSNLTVGSNQNNLRTQSNTANNGNAPFRVSFGTIARQDGTGTGNTAAPNTNPINTIANGTNGANGQNGTIPTRQPFSTSGGGLAPPNSPYTLAPSGINLQTGSTTPLAMQANNRSDQPLNETQPAVNQQPAGTFATQSQSQTQPNVPNSNQNQSQNQNLTQDPNATRSQLPNTSQVVGTQTSTSTSNPSSASNQNGFTDPADRNGSRRSITRVTKSMNQLPNDAGQVWREYDISPYTSQITGITDPQQAILDWILKETGTEMWFNQPLGILNADKNQLRVYHTPEIQERVHKIVDRFVNTRGQVQNVEVSLVTVGKPNWRSTAYPMLQPIEVQSPGVEAWMITKENAAILRSNLARRGDFKDHGTGRIGQNDGQTVVLRNTKPVQFIRNFRWTGNQYPPYQPLITTIDEGYTLEISSLSSLDGSTIEASIECHVDQVERLNTVKVDVPGAVGATTDRVSLQIPQLVSWRLKERFRWRNDQVLVLSCGVVATPGPQSNLPSALPNLLGGKRQRADALLFVDYRGPEMADRVPGNTARARTIPVNPRR